MELIDNFEQLALKAINNCQTQEKLKEIERIVKKEISDFFKLWSAK